MPNNCWQFLCNLCACIPLNRKLDKVSFKSVWNSNPTLLLVCCKVKLLYMTFWNILPYQFSAGFLHSNNLNSLCSKSPKASIFFQVGSKSEFLLLTQSSCPNSEDICKLTAFHPAKNPSVLFWVRSSNEFRKGNSRGKSSLNWETSSMKDVTCKIYLQYVADKLKIYVLDRFTS